MKIREATEADIPNILKVLKASLGETSSKKTELIWRYKHIENPFGKSLVLLAEQNGEVIGVRAFMRWKWQRGREVLSTYRAVDTATHPAHQGKGIFKKLTLKAIEIAKEDGGHFIFNTPNNQSKPGYLKMGWKEIGKLKVELIPTNPFFWTTTTKEDYKFEGYTEIDEGLLDLWNVNLKDRGHLFMPKKPNYLKWRYFENPLQDYYIVSTKNYFIAGYVKQHKYFRELRISEILAVSKSDFKLVKNEIKDWAKKLGVNLISVSVPGEKSIFFESIYGSFGPVLTFKNLDRNLEIDRFLKLDCWEYSLGDLELF